MAAIYHPGVVQIVAQYDIGGTHPAANVTHWQTSVTGLTLSQLQAMQSAFDGAWSIKWFVIGTNSTKYIGSIVTDMSSDTGASANNAGYTPVTGSKAGGAIGDQVAALISLHGGIRYRGGHSRIYIPGIDMTDTLNDGRNLTSTAVGQVLQIYTSTVTALGALSSANGGPLTPAIWHKHWSSAPNTVETVYNWTNGPLLATQRRRLRKVSRHKTKTP